MENTLSFVLSRRAFGLGASAAALAACSRPSGTAEAFVNVYSARHYDSDRALYAAKRAGRNRVTTSGSLAEVVG